MVLQSVPKRFYQWRNQSMSRPISILDVKKALRDSRFRDSLPEKFTEDLNKYLQNPGCACNLPIFKKLMLEGKEFLQSYFPNRPVANLDEEIKNIAQNNFSVINCKNNELQDKLRKLPPGRKQIAIARYEDEVTVIVNELDLIY